MDTTEVITVDEALAAVRRDAWTTQVETCGHTGCEDHRGPGPRYVHCQSGFGMDIPLEAVEQQIREAVRVGWVNGFMGHDLALITTEDRVRYYDVKRPPPSGNGA